ncbi:hypothetical protein Tco_0846876 [Tanacetum coccineum]
MKLMKFLMSLDDSNMQLRSNILSREPLLDAKGTYVIISNKESHKAVVTDSGVGTSQREDERVATSESDSANSEGGIEDVPDTELVQNKSLRRSDRSSVFLNKYNEYVVNSKVMFGF